MYTRDKQKIVCLDGISGSGKSHQIFRLSRLLGNNCVMPEFIQHPKFRTALCYPRGSFDEMLAAMNEAQTEYYKRAKDNPVVLMDRGVMSLLAYRPLTDYELPQLAVKPDLYVVLDCNIDTATLRIAQREQRIPKDVLAAQFETPDRLTFARNNYRTLVSLCNENAHLVSTENVSPEDVTDSILRLLKC